MPPHCGHNGEIVKPLNLNRPNWLASMPTKMLFDTCKTDGNMLGHTYINTYIQNNRPTRFHNIDLEWAQNLTGRRGRTVIALTLLIQLFITPNYAYGMEMYLLIVCTL